MKNKIQIAVVLLLCLGSFKKASAQLNSVPGILKAKASAKAVTDSVPQTATDSLFTITIDVVALEADSVDSLHIEVKDQSGAEKYKQTLSLDGQQLPANTSVVRSGNTFSIGIGTYPLGMDYQYRLWLINDEGEKSAAYQFER